MSLGLAAALLTAGALADDIGHGRVLMWSAGLLGASSAAGALAPSMTVLVAVRVAQGLGGGGVLAAGLGSIGRAFPAGHRRTHATAVWGAAVGAGIAVGPLAGAGLAAAFGWRSSYWLEAAGAAALMTAAATAVGLPVLMQRALHLSALGSAIVLAAWSATSMVVALAARSLPGRLATQTRVVIGLALAAAVALTGLGSGAGGARLLPGLIVAGVGSGIANAALGRLAVESVPHDRVGMGSGANNTARYLGGAAGVALIVTIVSSAGPSKLIQGWNTAALLSAGLSALGALIVASCRARR
jgi:Major Facilitator Superfamily